MFRRPTGQPPLRAAPPTLPLLQHVGDIGPADWLRISMTTFARSVASFLPAHFDAYVRVYHPFERGDGHPYAGLTWRALAAAAHAELNDRSVFEALDPVVPRDAHQPTCGTLPEALVGPLVESLALATATPANCFFAVWEGFGGSLVPPDLEPKLDLPHRRYHVFRGPIEGIRTSFDAHRYQSANLWWPSDRAWCVASEVDLHWTYVGGPRTCIEASVSDARLETMETTSSAFT